MVSINKLNLIAISIALLTSIASVSAQTFSGGEGTATSPYLISTVEDLQQLSADVNGGTTYSDVYFKLTADLNLSSVCGPNVEGKDSSWTPIGKYNSPADNQPFKGYFNGAGHTIKNLHIDFVDFYQGLFGYISGASIDSVNLVDTDILGGAYVGSVCGRANSSFIGNITNIGSVSGKLYVGGVCGFVDRSSATNNINNGSVNAEMGNLGGICGYALNSIVSYNINRGSVTGANDNNENKYSVGGVCGYADSSSISYCDNSGSVIGYSDVGGVCGYAYSNSSISYCDNSGSVIGYSDVGGVCGYAYSNSSISYSLNSGRVDGNNYTGGVCGQAYSNSSISYSYNSGSISGDDNVGGVCGHAEKSTISYSINSGRVDGGGNAGGVCGCKLTTSSMISCYYDKQMSNVVYGIGSFYPTSGSESTGTNENAENKLTTQMTGDALSSFLGTDNFVFTDNLYPRIKGLDTLDVAVVAATPIFLTAESSSDYETVDSVLTNFMVNTQNNVVWTVTPMENAMISDSLVVLLKEGEFTLTAGKNGVEYKSVVLNVVKKSPTVTWTVADYTYGETLTGKLNAIVEETEGTFVYKNGETVLTEDDNLDAGDYILTVEFTPTDSVNYFSSSDTALFTVGKAVPTVTWTVADYTYGETLTGKLNATVEETEGTFVYKNDETVLTEDDKLDAGDYILTVEFTPTDSVNYFSSSDTASFTVGKAVPTVTWTVADYTYGETLTGKLNATVEETEGTFVYQNDETVLMEDDKLDAGDYILLVEFTPTDSVNYFSSSDTASFTVGKAVPTISWESPEPIIEGTALSLIQLNATADVAGEFIYTPEEETVLESGKDTLRVEFIPSDTVNYSKATFAVEIDVKKSTDVEEILQNKIALCPNPTTLGFYIDLGTAETTPIEIYDQNGRLIQTVEVSVKQFVDISNYAQGTYLVKTANRKVCKVVKQ